MPHINVTLSSLFELFLLTFGDLIFKDALPFNTQLRYIP